MKIYTKKGDGGTTHNAKGEKIPKSSCLIEANGVIDELQTAIDKVIYGLDILPDMKFKMEFCINLQGRLRQLGAEISGLDPEYPIEYSDIDALEIQIDNLDEDVWEFVRFHSPIAMDIDEARVRTRKAERVLTTYLEDKKLNALSYAFINRLSDYFFILAVHIDRKFGE